MLIYFKLMEKSLIKHNHKTKEIISYKVMLKKEINFLQNKNIRTKKPLGRWEVRKIFKATWCKVVKVKQKTSVFTERKE